MAATALGMTAAGRVKNQRQDEERAEQDQHQADLPQWHFCWFAVAHFIILVCETPRMAQGIVSAQKTVNRFPRGFFNGKLAHSDGRQGL